MTRQFVLRRDGETVAEGIQLDHGTVVLRWLGGVPYWHMWASIEAAAAAHCRDGTQLKWVDDENTTEE